MRVVIQRVSEANVTIAGGAKAKIAAGFEPIMPTFRGQVSEEQMLALIAYIKSLSPNPAPLQRSNP